MEELPQPREQATSYQEALDLLRKGCRIELNWEAYYEEFSRKHGGKPVYHKGRTLFRDGWRYSGSDYDGMEYSPPTDQLELMELKVAYWSERLLVVKMDKYYLEEQLEKLKIVQAVRSVPLQYNFTMMQDDGTQKPQTGELNLKQFEVKISEFDTEIKECETNLNLIDPELRKLIEHVNAQSNGNISPSE